MNSGIIVIYVLIIVLLFFSANSLPSLTFKFKITFGTLLYLAVALLFITILTGKIYSLVESGSIIEPEIVAPAHMTPSGKEAMARVLAPVDSRTTLDNCILLHDCRSDEDTSNSRIIISAHDFIFSSINHDTSIEWLRMNSMTIYANASWRGRYLHHYSTILYPVREVLSGNYKLLLNSQYGLASLLPLFFLKDKPFIVYPLVSMIALGIFGLFVIFKHRRSINETIIIGALLTLIVLSCNVGALRLSPGFSFLRYLPVLLLLYIAKSEIENYKAKYFILAIVVALFDSLQFNLLILLIVSTVYLAVSIKDKTVPRFISVPLALVFVSGLQYLLYFIDLQGFTPELFGSVGEGRQSIVYTGLVILFPVLSILLKHLNKNPDVVVFTNTEILAYVSYGALATYTVSFVGSPQHYAGFLQMSCLSIYLIIKSCGTRINQLVLILFIFLFPSFSYNYLQIHSDFSLQKSAFYDYLEKSGERLYFRSPTDLSSIANEYADLVAKYALNKKVYFLSKDKIFIENYYGRNLDPKTYDVFVNYTKLSPVDTFAILTKERVDYVLLDSNDHRENTRNFINLERNYLTNDEYDRHIRILTNFNGFADLIKNNLIECSYRYCIYRVRPKI